jgi:hypothetical protein
MGKVRKPFYLAIDQGGQSLMQEAMETDPTRTSDSTFNVEPIKD